MTEHFLKIYKHDGHRKKIGDFTFSGEERFHEWTHAQNDKLSSFKFNIPQGWELWIHRHRSPISRYQAWPGDGTEVPVDKNEIEGFIHDDASGHSWVKTEGIQTAFENINENSAKQFSLNSDHPVALPAITKSSRHQQSIQRTARGEFIVTGSADDEGYFYLTDQNHKIVKVIAPPSNGYNHLGGSQVTNDILAVGYEQLSAGRKGTSKVIFYNVENIHNPQPLDHLTITRNDNDSTAGAVALTNVGDHWLLIVANWSAARLDFYKSNIEDLIQPDATFGSPFVSWPSAADGNNGSGWGGYQNINLFQGKHGGGLYDDLWFVGMHTNNYFSNEDWADLYQLHIANGAVSITKKRNKHFIRSGKGPRFRNGSGLFFDRDRKEFHAYSCEHSLSNNAQYNRCNHWN